MSSNSIDAIDAVTEGINRVSILDSEVQICANCGKEGGDVTNTCNKCMSVMYCNAACKKKHRHKHKKECAEHVKRAAERAAELHDEKLFKQPPPKDDCPICMIRLPSLHTGQTYMECCGKIICRGCIYAPVYDDKGNEVDNRKCPFCRTLPPSTDEEFIKRFEKRVELNDPTGINDLGSYYAKGGKGLLQNMAKALELWHRAGELLGYADAFYNIACVCYNGNGVEKDEKKANHYCELAAMGGNITARYNLAITEGKAGNLARAVKHFMISVKDGDFDSLQKVKGLYLNGHVTKDDYANALRSYQAYLDEIKSDQRDEAAAARKDYKYYESY